MQKRSKNTQAQILDGLVRVLVWRGLPGVTHRAVAQAAGVSLAATTRHFETKDAIIEALSARLLDGYLAGLKRLSDRIEQRAAPDIRSLHDVAARVALNGLVHQRDLSLAWCELILHGGRSTAGQAMARNWFAEIDYIWQEIGQKIEKKAPPATTALTVDLVIGLIFLLHPLGLTAVQAQEIIQQKKGIIDFLAQPNLTDTPVSMKVTENYQRVLNAAITVLVQSGPQAVNYQSVASQAGLSRAAPGYYFPNAGAMLAAAQQSLFDRAKDRYRGSFRAFGANDLGLSQLTDLTNAIYFSEAMEYPKENLAYYSIWIRSVAQADLRRPVLMALRDQQLAWKTTLERGHQGAVSDFAPLRMQAIFVGKLIRDLAAGRSVGDMARAHSQFAFSLNLK